MVESLSEFEARAVCSCGWDDPCEGFEAALLAEESAERHKDEVAARAIRRSRRLPLPFPEQLRPGAAQ